MEDAKLMIKHFKLCIYPAQKYLRIYQIYQTSELLATDAKKCLNYASSPFSERAIGNLGESQIPKSAGWFESSDTAGTREVV